jgi:enoyl-CoA hydratase/carnithine racemase
MTGEREAGVRVSIEARPEGVVARVVVDNEAKLNALSTPVMVSFVDAFAALARRDDLRVVVLSGAGARAFVGGADIGEMSAIGGPDAARAFITRVHRCCEAVRALPVPVIARIEGYVFGAGLELAAACDLRVAAEGSTFGMPEVKLGIPSVVEAALLPTLIGWGRAREVLLLGESFSASDAYAWGLVERLAPARDLDACVEDWIVKTLSCAPRAVRLQKALIRRWEDLPLRDAVAAGVDAFAAAFETDEPARALGAFLAARRARKTGAR